MTFQVIWQDLSFTFQEVSGLVLDSNLSDYRTILLKRTKTGSSLVLKRGLVNNLREFLDLYNAYQKNALAKSTVQIIMFDENQTPLRSWRLQNAIPTKMCAPDLKAEGNEVVIDSIELSYDGLEIIT